MNCLTLQERFGPNIDSERFTYITTICTISAWREKKVNISLTDLKVKKNNFFLLPVLV
jgi:hypothetical protein